METFLTLPNILMAAVLVGVVTWVTKMIRDRPEKAKTVFEDPLDKALAYLATKTDNPKAKEALKSLQDVQLVDSASSALNAPGNVISLVIDKITGLEERIKSLESKSK